MLTRELGVMKQMLEKEGFEVTVATLTGEPIVGKTKSLKPDRKLTEINLDDYIGVILPCMAVGNPGPIVPEVVDLVKRAFSQGKPVAAQFNAVITLAKAGVLAGKKYAYANEPPKYDEGFKDGTYAGSGVVQDGIIITSGVCPWTAKSSDAPDGTPKLTEMFIAELKRHR
jgi:putative intracellular protease/amidase